MCCCRTTEPDTYEVLYLGALNCMRVSGIHLNGKHGWSCDRDSSSTAQGKNKLTQHPSDPPRASVLVHHEALASRDFVPVVTSSWRKIAALPFAGLVSLPLELEIYGDGYQKRSTKVYVLRRLSPYPLFLFVKVLLCGVFSLNRALRDCGVPNEVPAQPAFTFLL